MLLSGWPAYSTISWLAPSPASPSAWPPAPSSASPSPPRPSSSQSPSSHSIHAASAPPLFSSSQTASAGWWFGSWAYSPAPWCRWWLFSCFRFAASWFWSAWPPPSYWGRWPPRFYAFRPIVTCWSCSCSTDSISNPPPEIAGPSLSTQNENYKLYLLYAVSLRSFASKWRFRWFAFLFPRFSSRSSSLLASIMRFYWPTVGRPSQCCGY